MRRLARSSVLLLAVSTAASAATAQLASLVQDLNAARGFANSSRPHAFRPLGDRALFAAFEPSGVPGDYLWASDGTTLGTLRLTGEALYAASAGELGNAALWFASTSAGPQLWRTAGSPESTFRLSPPQLGVHTGAWGEVADGFLFFTVSDLDGLSLWRTDGTMEGTELLVDYGGGRLDCGIFSAPEVAAQAAGAAAGQLFFLLQRRDPAGCDPVARELWVSDGTAAGTRRLRRLGDVRGVGPGLTPLGSRVLFLQASPGGVELWAADGSPGGTRRLATFPTAGTLTPFSEIQVLGGRAFFVAEAGGAGPEIWATDGTARGTRPVTALPAGAQLPAGISVRSHLALLGGRLLFPAADAATGIEPWIAGGKAGGTARVHDLCPGPCSSLSLLPRLVPLGTDRSFFFADDGTHGIEPWVTDGSAAGTSLLRDICPGGCGANHAARELGGRVYFYAFDPALGQELWSSDGTPEGTRPWTRFARDSPFEGLLGDIDLARLGPRLLLAADDGVHGSELWLANGSPGGTRLVADIAGGGAASGDPVDGQPLGERLLFLACNGDREAVFATDGSPAGTYRLADLSVDCDAFRGNRFRGQPSPLAVVAGVGYFDRGDLWATDGGPAPPTRLTDFDPVPGVRGIATALVDLGGEVAFGVCTGEDRCAPELWASDGSPKGTRRLTPLPADLSLMSLASAGGRLFFLARDEVRQWEVWTSDGTAGGTVPLTDRQDPQIPFTSRPPFVAAGGEVYFAVDDGGTGPVLWRTDGTPEGTRRLDGVFPPGLGRDPTGLSALGDTLHFIATSDFAGGRGLWRTDGTRQGTELLGGLGFGALATPPVALGESLFFLVWRDDGLFLWRSDGSPETTAPVLLLDPAPTDFGLELAAAGERLFFPGFDPATGYELWTSDGTAAGTRLLQEIAPGPGWSLPAAFGRAGSRLYFSADDQIFGRELWTLSPGDGEEPCAAAETSLCLAGRFRAEVSWEDAQGRPRRATAALLGTAPDSRAGLFSFLGWPLPDVAVKVLDGGAVNGHIWAFAGGLSSLPYALTVTDSDTGRARRYHHRPGPPASLGDTRAFAAEGPAGSAVRGGGEPLAAAESAPPPGRRAASGACQAGPQRLCLHDGRFAAEVHWTDGEGQGHPAAATALGDGHGIFFFQHPGNPEVVLKLVDGRPANGRFWVFAGSLTSLAFDLTVTDTANGKSRTYHNPRGSFSSVADPGSF